MRSRFTDVYWYCLKSNDKSLLKEGHEGNLEQINVCAEVI
jgi:hypothetical protein